MTNISLNSNWCGSPKQYANFATQIRVLTMLDLGHFLCNQEGRTSIGWNKWKIMQWKKRSRDFSKIWPHKNDLPEKCLQPTSFGGQNYILENTDIDTKSFSITFDDIAINLSFAFYQSLKMTYCCWNIPTLQSVDSALHKFPEIHRLLGVFKIEDPENFKKSV